MIDVLNNALLIIIIIKYQYNIKKYFLNQFSFNKTITKIIE